MNKLFYILIILFLSGCVTTREKTRTETSETKKTVIDTTTVKTEIKKISETEVKETIIISMPDSASIIALAKCDSFGNVYIAEITELRLGKKVKPSVRIIDNYIYADCIIDSFEVYMIYRHKFDTTKTETETNVKKTEKTDTQTTVKTKKVTVFSRFSQIITGVLVFVVIIVVIFLLLKFRIFSILFRIL